jgi:hypothetical protein
MRPVIRIFEQKRIFARSHYQQLINNISFTVQTTISISFFKVNLSFRCTRSAIRFHLLIASGPGKRRIVIQKTLSLQCLCKCVFCELWCTEERERERKSREKNCGTNFFMTHLPRKKFTKMLSTVTSACFTR